MLNLDSNNASAKPINCPICRTTGTYLFSKYDCSILYCQKCSHQFADIIPNNHHTQTVYGDHYFNSGGDGYPDYLGEAKLILDHGKRYAQLLKRYMDTGTILDVGAAAGFILQGFTQSGWQGKGIEPNAEMVNHDCKSLGLSVEVGSLETISTSDRYDLISMIQVMPHFFDLRQALSNAANITKPNGYWLIETWNRDSLTAKICGQHWHEYSPPSVLHWFSPNDLEQLATQFGFYKVICGRPSKWINGAHIKSLLRYKLERSRLGRLVINILSIIPDNLAIPYPAEDLFWILFQKAEAA
ncbi:methyltransferase domain-containing protein [Pseudanabaena sp. UWO311]|uniref:class I SAM-dependent methyltransferase n=1 Tax=Pseudanabaena sp. UWO311 TaxID=2487337 RepID=UPI00115747D8|nr:class I SAM-dependent methyltransferase [Pseudanabaena sp. UWO311]TYQ24766.1 methyltransferase domain-containing protein [Pseudanabaena sp. UWO311]